MITATIILLGLLIGIMIADWESQREREKAGIKMLHRNYYSRQKFSERLFEEMIEDDLYKESL